MVNTHWFALLIALLIILLTFSICISEYLMDSPYNLHRII